MKKLFNYCRLCLKLLSRNLSTLLAFEIIYSVITVFLIYPILSFSIDKTMSLSGLTYLSNDNIIYYLSRPATIFIWLAVLLVSCLVVIFKIMSVTWYVHASYNQKDISIVQMFKLGGKCTFKPFKSGVILIFLYTLLFTTAISGFTGVDAIPEFIQDYIYESNILSILMFCLYTILFILSIRFSLNYTCFCFESKNFVSASKKSLALTKKNFFIVLLGRVAPVVLIFFIGFIIKTVFSVSSILIIKFFCEPDMQYLYSLKAVRAADMISIAVQTLSLTISYASLSVIYYKLKNKKQEPIPKYIPPKGKKHILLNYVCLGIVSVIFIGFTILTAAGAPDDFAFDINNEPEISAHRGSSVDYPENSIPAYAAAIEQGADWIELDVHQTADNIVVISHDANIKRIAGVDKNIWEMTYAELETYDVGSWFSDEYSYLRLPTLDEVLKLCKGKIKLNIEIKPTGHETDFEKNVIDIVKANGFENDCMLASLDIEALKKVKEIDPNIKTLYDMTVAAGNISEMTFIDGFSIEETFIDYDIVDQIHQNNKKVFVWTVNEPSNIINICKYDIDNILTDDPLTAREVINEEKLSDSTVDFVNLFFKEEMRTQYINQ